jgi:hypothetical protein
MKCQNCGIREGTENWVGQGSVLDYAHGNYQMWCKLCVAKAQLKNAEKVVKTIPKLKARVKSLSVKK